MQLNFEELKTLFRSLDADVNELIIETDGHSDYELARSEDAFDQLNLISKVAAELCKFRPKLSKVK